MLSSSTSKVLFKKRINKDELEERNLNINWWILFGIIFLCAFITRIHKIEEPNHVCWDETHFGKFGSWYINRTFFFDVHPPLGKMLIGLSGKLTGYNGSFAFNKPGDKYLDHNYLGMRIFCATLGMLIIPFTFITIWELTYSLSASFLAALLVTFDVGLLTLSQYILLDPILLFFISGSFMGSAKFNNCSKEPFSLKWWFWLSWTGVFLTCSVSVKFVGIFIVLLIGLRVINELWQILGDLTNPITLFFKHLFYRALCLIVLPIILYAIFFYIHLKVLSKSGSGDGFFSSAFQSQLEGNSLYNASMPKYVAYGSVITLKNNDIGGGYLHSHFHLYPEGVGARQQQVTAYTHKDSNNEWMIKNINEEPHKDDNKTVIVRNGDLIRLEHLTTRRNLHSHKERAPVTKKHYQVTCYGEDGVGDANDIWQVFIVNGEENEEIKTVTSRLKFVHYLTKCALHHSHSKQLPKWGYEQIEVTCNPNILDKNTVWNVENNYFERLPKVSFSIYAPSFLEKFIESHLVMFQGNSNLKPKEGEITSRPWQWPINYKGQYFSGNEYRIYLLGNPIIWWSNLAFLTVYMVIKLSILIRRQRGCETEFDKNTENDRFINATIWLFIGWFLHYAPFFAMGRVLYFHHYFPALLFSSSLTAVVFDYLLKLIIKNINAKHRYVVFHTIYGLIVSIIVYSFYLFSPLGYGFQGATGHDFKYSDNNNQTNSLRYIKWLES